MIDGSKLVHLRGILSRKESSSPAANRRGRKANYLRRRHGSGEAGWERGSGAEHTLSGRAGRINCPASLSLPTTILFHLLPSPTLESRKDSPVTNSYILILLEPSPLWLVHAHGVKPTTTKPQLSITADRNPASSPSDSIDNKDGRESRNADREIDEASDAQEHRLWTPEPEPYDTEKYKA